MTRFWATNTPAVLSILLQQRGRPGGDFSDDFWSGDWWFQIQISMWRLLCQVSIKLLFICPLVPGGVSSVESNVSCLWLGLLKRKGRNWCEIPNLKHVWKHKYSRLSIKSNSRTFSVLLRNYDPVSLLVAIRWPAGRTRIIYYRTIACSPLKQAERYNSKRSI